MPDLDDIRLTEPADLTNEEKGFLKEHQEELSDEEKETYKGVLEEKEKKEEKEEGLSFKSEEELNTYLDKYYDTRKKKEEEGGEEKEEEKEEEGGGEEPLFATDYKPKDWNEFGRDLLAKAPAHLKESVREEIRTVREEEGKRIQEINKEFDQEIEALRKIDKDIPASGTEERRKFDKDLAQTMVDYPGVMNMTQSYKIYKAVKGTETKKEGEKEEETSTDETARKVGKSGGGSSTSTRRLKYKTIATRDLDDAAEAALKRLEEGA